MKNLLISSLIIILLLLVTGCAGELNTYTLNKVEGQGEDYLLWPGVTEDEYNQQCPYGDVIVIKKENKDLLNKHGLIYRF